MSRKLTILKQAKNQLNPYLLSKSITPFPDSTENKSKPPTSKLTLEDNSHLFNQVEEEIPWQEKARREMDKYRKVERILINNFYTGGGAYTRGILDSMYRGLVPQAR